MGIAEQLDAAADLLGDGWIRGTFHRETKGQDFFCLMGAVSACAPAGRDLNTALSFVMKAIGTDSLLLWNDDFQRTQAEVVAAVRKAAELARVSGTPQENVEAKSQ
jgi:hypothetical protein